jgi:hypothetical protein
VTRRFAVRLASVLGVMILVPNILGWGEVFTAERTYGAGKGSSAKSGHVKLDKARVPAVACPDELISAA